MYVCVCVCVYDRNSKQMPRDVRNTVIDIVRTEGNMSESAAKTYVRQLERTRRYRVEAWS